MLVVGVWPGADPNAYVSRFVDSLKSSGIIVKDVDHPLRAVLQKIDLFHIHWPEKVFWGVGKVRGALSAIGVLLGLVLLKSKGVKIVWCVHNLDPHDRGPKFMALWRPYIWMFTLLIDGFVTLSPSTVGLARRHLPGLANKPGTFIWHPEYLVDASIDRAEWRSRNGIAPADKLFAFVGQIRRYKGIEELVKCFSRTDDPTYRLLIAGVTWSEGTRRFLQSSAECDSRIVLKLGNLVEREFASATLSADIVILPFKKYFHSGSIIYALSCGKPVCTPTTAYATDLRDQVGHQWMQLYQGDITPWVFTDTLTSSEVAKPGLEFLSIDSSGAKIRYFYEALLANR